MAEGADLSFVHLGISVEHMAKGFSIGGISVAYYGVIIGIGMIAGLFMAQADAKRRGQDPELYLDFALYAIFFQLSEQDCIMSCSSGAIIKTIWQRLSI